MHPASPHSAANSAPLLARRSYRHSICTLAYVRIDHANGGIIRNLSDTGIAIQAVGRLHPEQVVHLRFELIRPRAKFELVGQVTWADAKGQAGLRFTDAPASSRRLLKDWILTDLLAATQELNVRSPILESAAAGDGLLMSSLPFEPIRLSAKASENRRHTDAPKRVNVPWWPTSIRKATLAYFIDAIVVTSAVLLFSILAAELTAVVPSALVLACTSLILASVFTALYACLCHFFIRDTLGWRLAQLAAADDSEDLTSPVCDPY